MTNTDLFIIDLFKLRELSPDSAEYIDWENKYIPQIVAIANQWPHHFEKSVANQGIPNDTKIYDCYLCLSPDREKVWGFLVVIPSSFEVEALWGAIVKDAPFAKSDLFAKLFSRVEKDHFYRESGPNALMIFGKIPTEDSVCEGSEVAGIHWKKTYRFYKKIGYKKTYRLNHYWGNQNHAYIIVKRNPEQTGTIGTNLWEETEPRKSVLHFQDRFPVINRELWENLYPYLSSYRDGVNNLLTKPSIKQGLDGQIAGEGFAGVAFFKEDEDIATIFVGALDENPDRKKYTSKYEYEISSSLLTQMLSNQDLNEFSVLDYEIEYDHNSELKIHTAFQELLPDHVCNEGYSIFIHRIKGTSDNSYIVFYMVVGRLSDVIVTRQRWQMLSSDYSMLLLFSLHNIINVLMERKYNDIASEGYHYLKRLSDCVHLPAGWGKELEHLAKRADQIILDDVYSSMDAALAHDIKSVLSHSVLEPLHDIAEKVEEYIDEEDADELRIILRRVNSCIYSCEQYTSNLKIFLRAFREIESRLANSGCGHKIESATIKEWAGEMLGEDTDLNYNGPDSFTAKLSPAVFQVLLQFISNNIVDAHQSQSEYMEDDSGLCVVITVEPKTMDGNQKALLIKIWNSGTRFPAFVMEHGGCRPSTTYIETNRSGMGLYFVERILRKVDAKEFEADCGSQRHFLLRNTENPAGAEFSFQINAC
ncbi:hypothetical protein [Maridesulfovibrio sp.]|uniref:hypothetical protein n=1 Tax=Maridesulfovibrio sp. TaxID=2795000 RepID=UPI0039F1323C